MTFVTILGVTEILCSFKLVLEGKWDRESSRLDFLEEFLANNFALSDAEDNTSKPLNRVCILDLPSPPRQTKILNNSNILHMFNNHTYTDFRATYKHILIPSYIVQLT